LLDRLRVSGHVVTIVDGDRVRVQGAPLTQEQIERVKSLKGPLLPSSPRRTSKPPSNP
jgi:hypothetical protein